MTAFFTFAYNASSTLPRTIESILNQTCQDWIYYLCDNGSTLDNTREIIKEYASRDSRIIPIYMDENDPYEASRIGFSKISNSNADYFCMVDADDEYYPEFLEKALDFMEAASLDIVACGNDFIDAQSSRVLGVRKISNRVILEDRRSYDSLFAVCHQFMRTIWGKIYKVALFREFDFCNKEWDYYKVVYGGDTLFFMKMATYAKRVGILDESLHRYYVSAKSSSYNWNPHRLEADRVLYERAIDFLYAKVGYVSEYNKCFLDQVYLNAVRDTLVVMFRADVSRLEIFHVLRDVFSFQYTVSALTNENIDAGFRKKLSEEVLNAIQSWSEMEKTEDGIWLGLNLSAMVEDQDQYIRYSIANIAFLIDNNILDRAEEELAEWEKLLPNNQALCNLRKRLVMKSLLS